MRNSTIFSSFSISFIYNDLMIFFINDKVDVFEILVSRQKRGSYS
jgi:hypothetical protein